MITTREIEQRALRLPEPQRAQLATRILDSLTPHLTDADDGLAEAQTRSNELDTGRSTALTQRELDEKLAIDAMGLAALASMRARAKRLGLDRMTDQEIIDIVNDTRRRHREASVEHLQQRRVGQREHVFHFGKHG